MGDVPIQVADRFARIQEKYFSEHGADNPFVPIETMISTDLGMDVVAYHFLIRFFESRPMNERIIKVPHKVMQALEPEFFLSAIASGAYDPVKQEAAFTVTLMGNGDWFVLQPCPLTRPKAATTIRAGMSLVASGEFIHCMQREDGWK